MLSGVPRLGRCVQHPKPTLDFVSMSRVNQTRCIQKLLFSCNFFGRVRCCALPSKDHLRFKLQNHALHIPGVSKVNAIWQPAVTSFFPSGKQETLDSTLVEKANQMLQQPEWNTAF
eukprot:2623317-Pleurochrysis_carterae.AAC.1